MADAIEQWRPVLGYEGAYEVSDQGRVRSLPGGSRHAKILAPIRQHRGHLMVSLYRDRQLKPRFIHRLVLEAFVCLPDPGQVCRHLNGDPSDNCVENLKWGTQLENARDMVMHGRAWQSQKTHCPSGHEYSEENTRHWKGRRHCRTCNVERARAWRDAQKKECAS